VLGAVIGGHVRAAQRERGRRNGEKAARQLLRGRTELRGGADELHDDCAAEHGGKHAGTLERQTRLRQGTADLGDNRQRICQPRRPA